MLKRTVILVMALMLTACGSTSLPTLAVPPTEAPKAAATAVPPATERPTVTPAASPVRPTSLPTETETAAPPPTPTAAASPSLPAAPRLPAGQALDITSIHMLDATNGWGTGKAMGAAQSGGDTVLRTRDGGATWSEVTPPEPAPAEGEDPGTVVGYFPDDASAWVTYARYYGAPPAGAVVWRTHDGGQSWQASAPLDLSSASFYGPSDIFFLDAQTGWMLVHVDAGMMHDYIMIFQTSDGGQTWAKVLDPMEGGPQSCSKTAIGFFDAQHGWMTGDCMGVVPGVFLVRTEDGGRTWTDIALPAPADAPDIITRSDAWCGTYALSLFPPQQIALAMSCTISGDTLLVQNYLYTSADGGQSWQAASAPSSTIVWLDSAAGFALQKYDPNNPTAPLWLSQTADGGQTWAQVKQVNWYGALDFITAQQGWAVARSEDKIALVATTSGGAKWSLLQPKISP